MLGEARGYADVFYRDHFAWENKAPGRNLDTAVVRAYGWSDHHPDTPDEEILKHLLALNLERSGSAT